MTPPISSTPTLHVWTRDEIVATWDRVLISVYRVETTMSGILAVQQIFDDLVHRSPGGALLLTIIEDNAPYPPPEVRAQLARFLHTRASQIILSAVAYEGSGFRTAAVRSIVAGLALVANLPYRHKIFATVTEAAHWLCANSPIATPWSEADLVSAVTDVRAPDSDRRLRVPAGPGWGEAGGRSTGG